MAVNSPAVRAAGVNAVRDLGVALGKYEVCTGLWGPDGRGKLFSTMRRKNGKVVYLTDDAYAGTVIIGVKVSETTKGLETTVLGWQRGGGAFNRDADGPHWNPMETLP